MVLAFFASQFIAYFGKTNLGLIVSFKGADALEAAGLQAPTHYSLHFPVRLP